MSVFRDQVAMRIPALASPAGGDDAKTSARAVCRPSQSLFLATIGTSEKLSASNALWTSATSYDIEALANGTAHELGALALDYGGNLCGHGVECSAEL